MNPEPLAFTSFASRTGSPVMKGRARDRTDDLLDGVGTLAAANEIVASGGRRPGLPLHVLGRDRLAEADVVFRDQDVDGLQLNDRCSRQRFVVRPAREVGGNSAGTDGDGQHDNACGIHTLHFPHYAATLPPP